MQNEIIEEIEIDGCKYESVSPYQALEIGATQEDVDLALARQAPSFSEDEARQDAKNRIDAMAGKSRLSVSGTEGDLIDIEYQITGLEAKAWDANGRPENAVPISISAWALAADKTNDEACTEILLKHEQWIAAVMKIRSARLEAGRQVYLCNVEDLNRTVVAFEKKLVLLCE